MAVNAPIAMSAASLVAAEGFAGTVLLVASPASAHELQLGALAALRDSGLGLSLLLADPASPNCLADARRMFEAHRPVGVVLAAVAAPGDFAALCRDAGSRHVAIAPDAGEETARLVCSNDRQGASDVMRYLLALGHRRIGFVAGPEHCRASRERELGHLDAMAEHGLDHGAELAAQGDGSVASGREAGRLLLAVSPRPTAILASSDAMAAGVLQAAHTLGVAVPGQLSVIGFGDTPLAEACWPPLTTMRLPWAEMAFTAAIKLIDPARAETQPVEFFCELVPRGSTGPVDR